MTEDTQDMIYMHLAPTSGASALRDGVRRGCLGFISVSSYRKMLDRVLLLIILLPCVCGSLIVSQSFYQAEENDNITLEWNFTTTTNSSPSLLFVSCDLIADQELSVLYRVQDGVEVSELQDKRFAGRVWSDSDALTEGRIALQLSGLTTHDSGLYVCKVSTDHGYGSDSCRLNVTAGDLTEPETSHAGLVGIFVGIALMGTTVLVLFCYLFIRSLLKEQDYDSESSYEAEKTFSASDDSL
ncbi:uncharacterized protein LOC102794298 isoform X2 [Neolamprologus brichardi]|uniref:uncharacterized protein LOC102794298 isoform X2 n=1 Tax=Neolamprologus brichardi TaxID=32507 RepID=UPI001643E817|nr:uncharacterized protein LOC102794298 isoform X2 [Neolamprologus brichardi]